MKNKRTPTVTWFKKKFHEQWDFLSKNPGGIGNLTEKKDWAEYKKIVLLLEKGELTFPYNEHFISYACFPCQVAIMKHNKKGGSTSATHCGFCPVPGWNTQNCVAKNTIYQKWLETIHPVLRANYAKKIRDSWK